MDESKLKQMDCVTCHNRVTHNFKPPISQWTNPCKGFNRPGHSTHHQKAVDVLSAKYETRDEAVKAIAAIEEITRASL